MFFIQTKHLRKRHKAWSNCWMVTLLNRGVLSKKKREKCIVKTTQKKVKDGKTSFSGNRFLKGTQLEIEL